MQAAFAPMVHLLERQFSPALLRRCSRVAQSTKLKQTDEQLLIVRIHAKSTVFEQHQQISGPPLRCSKQLAEFFRVKRTKVLRRYGVKDLDRDN
jgi:hypothetical protein